MRTKKNISFINGNKYNCVGMRQGEIIFRQVLMYRSYTISSYKDVRGPINSMLIRYLHNFHISNVIFIFISKFNQND